MLAPNRQRIVMLEAGPASDNQNLYGGFGDPEQGSQVRSQVASEIQIRQQQVDAALEFSGCQSRFEGALRFQHVVTEIP